MSDEDILERRELDQTLGEAAAIGVTWATYRRFLNGRLRVSDLGLHMPQNQDQKVDSSIQRVRPSPQTKQPDQAKRKRTL